MKDVKHGAQTAGTSLQKLGTKTVSAAASHLVHHGDHQALVQSRPRSRAVGQLAVGALALGAGAIGALAIGRLRIGKAVIGELRVERLIVQQLQIETWIGERRG